MASYIGSKERRMIYQSMAFSLKVGMSCLEAGEAGALGFLKAERKDQAEAAKSVGKALEDLATQYATNAPAPSPAADANGFSAPLVDLIEKAFGFAGTGAGAKLSSLEYASFAISERTIRHWAVQRQLGEKLALVFGNAAEAASEIKGAI